MPPELGTTRWHGMMIGMTFSAHTVPTARYALGEPTASATSPYVLVSPYGMSCSASSTATLNSVPPYDRGRSNPLRLPERYSFTWAAASERTSVSRSSMAGRFWQGRYSAVTLP